MLLALLLVHLLVTLMMTGVLWFVQVVHYPLMGSVGEANFQSYEGKHVTLTGYVLAPIMLLEAGTAALLVVFPVGDFDLLWWGNAILLAALWVSTFRVQVPLHNRLMQGFEMEAWKHLTRSNWFRTVLWSLRALLLCVYLYIELK
ncbi:MAG: hypothetical protein ACFB10_10755 [Salibacteraceae bacterium]